MRSGKPAEIKVFISGRDSVCDECDAVLGRRAWIQLVDDRPICLSCADLDQLLFLPSGDAALTRRAKKYSTLWAVVLKWSRARGHYERQGLLVEEGALERAEQECLADAEVRARRRLRNEERRAKQDQEFIRSFAKQVRALYPRCPKNRERLIAAHACCKYSGRVGRTALAKQLDHNTIRSAVVAHVRHVETRYDGLLGEGWGRLEARELVRPEIDSVINRWTGGLS